MAQNALAVRQSEEVQVNLDGRASATCRERGWKLVLRGRDARPSADDHARLEGPPSYARSFHVINGRPTLSADAMVTRSSVRVTPTAKVPGASRDGSCDVGSEAPREREQSCTFTLRRREVRRAAREARDSNWSKYPRGCSTRERRHFRTRPLLDRPSPVCSRTAGC